MVAEGADAERPAAASMELVRFEDVAAEVGLDFRHSAFRWETDPGDPVAMMGGGICWIDYDRDGWLDLYAVDTWTTVEWGRWRTEGAIPVSRLYRNDAGRFVDVTDETGAAVETRGSGCVAADLDLDGWTDLYVTSERNNVLLWNDAGTGFVDDSTLDTPSGATPFGWHAGAAVGDVDGDGLPDLFVAGYTDLNRPIVSSTSGFPKTHEPEPDLLFLNEGAVDGGRVMFREVAASVGIEPDGPDYGLGAVFSDLDDDGDLDLYVANDTNPNQLYEHVPDDGAAGFRFVEQGETAGVGDRGAGMGVAAADGDGDGMTDLVVTNQLDENDLVLRNVSGDSLAFVDVLDEIGLPGLGLGSTGWGATWADLDLDTDLDLFVAHGAIPVRDLDADRQVAQIVENRGGLGEPPTFSDASEAVGLFDVGPRLGRGAAAADYDNDGDVDIAMGTIGGDITLLRNSGAGGTWLIVDAAPATPGTLVTAELPDGRRVTREIVAGSSYLSSEDPRVHLGLDGAEQVAVTVEWPDGASRALDEVAADQILRVEPADG